MIQYLKGYLAGFVLANEKHERLKIICPEEFEKTLA